MKRVLLVLFILIVSCSISALASRESINPDTNDDRSDLTLTGLWIEEDLLHVSIRVNEGTQDEEEARSPGLPEAVIGDEHYPLST